MTRKEKMREARDNYINYLLSTGHNYVSIDNMEALFEAGVKWCDANSPTPWISVKDDLPCFHKELIYEESGKFCTKQVIVYSTVGIHIDWMECRKGKWEWHSKKRFPGITNTDWFPIPELPKE